MLQTVDTNPPAISLWTRYEHGNRPVRIFRDGEETRYELGGDAGPVVFGSARAMLSSLYGGRDLHVPFDRYFRIGRYRRAGRASGQADLLTLLDVGPATTRRTPITVHARATDAVVRVHRSTRISVSRVEETSQRTPVPVSREVLGEEKPSPDPMIEDLVRALGEDLRTQGGLLLAPEVERELDAVLGRELDRITGVVGIDLGAESRRSGSKTRADEVRRLLWKGFAGKMLSRGYDPEDVLQEVYRGLLVRNRGTCPWDARKSTFGHYVHMCISCILTNYHRKVSRRPDLGALSIDRDVGGEDRADAGAFGSRQIWDGSDVGDRLALENLARWLEDEDDVLPEAVLGREILPLVGAGHTRHEIVMETGESPPLVSRALAWLRERTAEWATEGGFRPLVPAKYLS